MLASVFQLLVPFYISYSFFLDKPSSERISAEGTPLENMFATGWAQVA